MTIQAKLLICALAISIPIVADELAMPPKSATTNRFDFENDSAGKLPEGWLVGNSQAPGAKAKWEVFVESDNPKNAHYLQVTIAEPANKEATHGAGAEPANVSWTNEAVFRDGRISARLRTDAGKQSQNAGLVWRVQNAEDYYLCTYNVLEESFRLYAVKAGERRLLASEERVKIPAGQWFKIEMTQSGDEIECSLDGAKYLTANDNSLPEAGGVGFWTNGDAASSFDDLEVAAEGAAVVANDLMTEKPRTSREMTAP